MPRPKLLKIRLIYSVEGSQVPLELDIEPAKVTSLFFNEHAAVEILGGFYEGAGRIITRDQAIARFGTRAEGWFPKDKDSLPLNKALLKLAWGNDTKKPTRKSGARVEAPADVHPLPVVLMKDPSCLPSGGP
jgi:hypothetical protein